MLDSDIIPTNFKQIAGYSQKPMKFAAQKYNVFNNQLEEMNGKSIYLPLHIYQKKNYLPLSLSLIIQKFMNMVHLNLMTALTSTLVQGQFTH